MTSTNHSGSVPTGRFGISDHKILAVTSGYIELSFGDWKCRLCLYLHPLLRLKRAFFSLGRQLNIFWLDILHWHVETFSERYFLQRKTPSCLTFYCFNCEMVRLLDTVCQRLEENHLSSQVSCCLKSLELHWLLPELTKPSIDPNVHQSAALEIM